jgi:hypothetical protein
MQHTTKKTKFDLNLLSKLQFVLAFTITVLYGLSLWQPNFYEYVMYLAFIIVIQLLISIGRLRIANIFIELILLVLLLPSLIPILGVVVILFGFLISLIEIATFKHNTLYKTVEFRTFNNFKDNKSSKNSSKTSKLKKKTVNFKDADFKEK